MNDSMQLLILSSIFGLILSSVIFLLMKAQVKVLNQTIDNLNSNLKSRETTIESLLNRMQAGDLKTLLSLQTQAPQHLTSEYRSSSDAAELAIIAHGQGLGMELYDDGVRDADEFLAAAEELGIPIERE